jgi:hypothetical protein
MLEHQNKHSDFNRILKHLHTGQIPTVIGEVLCYKNQTSLNEMKVSRLTEYIITAVM